MKKGKEKKANKNSMELKKVGIKKNIGPKHQTNLKPLMKWQTGSYSRHAEFQFILPYQFLLLCRLMEVTPDQIITDFMDNLSCSSWKREGRDKAREKLIDYFIEHGYGQHYYPVEDVRNIFRELDAIGLLWPVNAKDKMVDIHTNWRDKYHNYWFKKWFKKPRRKL